MKREYPGSPHYPALQLAPRSPDQDIRLLRKLYTYMVTDRQELGLASRVRTWMVSLGIS